MMDHSEYCKEIIKIDSHLDLKIVDKLALLLTEYSISGFKSLKEFNVFVVERGWLCEFGELYELQHYGKSTLEYSHSKEGMKFKLYKIALRVLEFPEPEAQFRLINSPCKDGD